MKLNNEIQFDNSVWLFVYTFRQPATDFKTEWRLVTSQLRVTLQTVNGEMGRNRGIAERRWRLLESVRYRKEIKNQVIMFFFATVPFKINKIKILNSEGSASAVATSSEENSVNLKKKMKKWQNNKSVKCKCIVFILVQGWK